MITDGKPEGSAKKSTDHILSPKGRKPMTKHGYSTLKEIGKQPMTTRTLIRPPVAPHAGSRPRPSKRIRGWVHAGAFAVAAPLLSVVTASTAATVG
ncbi:hypothetical protein [Streptomyces sp. NPDC018972]|uniref:hypothetical protein n=1 Tax=Streptomyces sp. NPDC018972 TaxID=3365060 RepID=UPI0037B957E4